MENYLADLNRQYASLEDEIQDLTSRSRDKQAEIEEAQALWKRRGGGRAAVCGYEGPDSVSV